VRRLIQILLFREMIAPIVLQMLFWAGVAGCLYGAYVLHALGNSFWPLPAILGPLIVRVIFEQAILAFRSYDRLGEIRDQLGS